MKYSLPCAWRRTIVQLTLFSSVTLSIIFQTRSIHSLRLRKEKNSAVHLHFHWLFHWFRFNEPNDIFLILPQIFRPSNYSTFANPLPELCEKIKLKSILRLGACDWSHRIINNLAANCGLKTKIINSGNKSAVGCTGTGSKYMEWDCSWQQSQWTFTGQIVECTASCSLSQTPITNEQQQKLFTSHLFIAMGVATSNFRYHRRRRR